MRRRLTVRGGEFRFASDYSPEYLERIRATCLYLAFFGADEHSLPHYRAIRGAKNNEEDAAIEDERRLAYVAFTRARRKLIVVTTDKPSPFLVDAGIMSEHERSRIGAM
ncbi:MAG: hypothetical protein Kow00129_07990 [Thermoleophilia bacterium]